MGLRVGGLVSGLDTNTLVEGLLALERRPLDLVTTRRDDLQAERSLFLDLNRRLDALRDAVAALDNRNSLLTGASFDEELLSYSASSSDEDAVQATANSNASPGTIDLQVLNLAQPARVISTSFSSDTDVIASAGSTLTIDHGGEDPIQITVGSEGASLVDLRGLINADVDNGGRVRAEAIFDGASYRLVVSGIQGGVANDVFVTTDIPGEGASPFVDTGLGQAASDARLVAFGLPVTRDSNEITDLVPGVTLSLQAQLTGPVEIQVSRDDEAINERVQTFIDAFNSVMEFAQEQARFNETTDTAGPLSGDFTLRNVQRSLQDVIGRRLEFANNPFSTLVEIGISSTADGLLELDAAALAAAFEENVPAVRQLLGGEDDGGTFTNGIATEISAVIDRLTLEESIEVDGETVRNVGPLIARLDGFDDRISSLDDQILRLETRLEERETLLVRQFSQLESTLAALQGQQNSLLGLTTINR